MSTSVSHHHFRWLNQLMQHLGIPSVHSTPLAQPDTDDQSKLYTDMALAQAARQPESPTITQVEASHEATEPAIAQEEADRARGSVPSASQALPAGADTRSPTHLITTPAPTAQSMVEQGNLLRCKKVRLVMNPRPRHNFTRISDVLAVFSAAGWKTDMVVKLHGGHAMELAIEAVEDGYDLVIVYGGDRTIHQVVNGLMAANGKRQPGIVGVLPGGAANQWVTETSELTDPVKAALSLIGSEVGTVDLGHIQVQELKFPKVNQGDQKQQKKGRKAQKRKAKQPSGVENYFLLTASLDIDAAEVLSEKHAFPIEIASIEADGQDTTVLWSGEALQVILGNTRRYTDVVEVTPDAYIDDGKLDLSVITEGNTLTTLEQMISFLFRHKPASNTARNFQSAHFLITVPAAIHLQLDGNPIQLEDYLSKADREALQQVPDRAQVMVSYRFDAVPHALRVALPQTNTLFGQGAGQPAVGGIGAIHRPLHEQQDGQHDSSDLVATPLEDGYEVTITGIVMVPGKRQRYVIAGHREKQETGETKPVAIRIDEDATVFLQTGEHVPHADVLKLQDGAKIVVAGKKNKRGVMKAKQVMLTSF